MKPDAGENVECPFCHDRDFDLPGLKHHYLAGHCDEFNRTERVRSLFERAPDPEIAP